MIQLLRAFSLPPEDWLFLPRNPAPHLFMMLRSSRPLNISTFRLTNPISHHKWYGAQRKPDCVAPRLKHFQRHPELRPFSAPPICRLIPPFTGKSIKQREARATRRATARVSPFLGDDRSAAGGVQWSLGYVALGRGAVRLGIGAPTIDARGVSATGRVMG